jgi:hypothetical protein
VLKGVDGQRRVFEVSASDAVELIDEGMIAGGMSRSLRFPVKLLQ